jgi:hypothetical protein
MHGQAVIAGTRVVVSVILDCLAAGMTTEEITAENPTVTVTGVRGRRLRHRACARGTAPAAAIAVKLKLDKNLLVSSAAILTSADHDVDTVTEEGLVGTPDRDVVAAATATGRILISLDRGLDDIRAYPPCSHAGIVVLRLTRPVRRRSHEGSQRPGHPHQSLQPCLGGGGPAARTTAYPPPVTRQPSPSPSGTRSLSVISLFF